MRVKKNSTHSIVKNHSISFSALLVMLILVSLLSSASDAFSQPVPYLTFTMKLPDTLFPPGTLTLWKDSTVIKSWKAGSGDNDPRHWDQQDVGPIPPGIWRVNAESWMETAERPGWPLEKITYTGPRFGFWIHGDGDYVTKGCIGLKASASSGYTDLDYADFSQTLWNDPDVVSAIVGNSFFLQVSYPGVGGVVLSIDKLGLLAPYVGLASTILVATVATALYAKRVKHRKEKQ